MQTATKWTQTMNSFNSVFYLTIISGEEHNYQAPHHATFSSFLLLNMLTNKQTLNSLFFLYTAIFSELTNLIIPPYWHTWTVTYYKNC